MTDDLSPGDLLADRDHLRVIVEAGDRESDDTQYLRCLRSANTAVLYVSVRRSWLGGVIMRGDEISQQTL